MCSVFYVWNVDLTIVVKKKDPLTLAPHTIRFAANATATREIASQREQFRKLGIMADWSSSSTYRTLGMQIHVRSLLIRTQYHLDHSYEIKQLRIFQKMVERGVHYVFFLEAGH